MDLSKEITERQLKSQSKYTKCICGTNLQYVLEVGRVGCCKCYDIFNPTLKQLVKQLNSKHIGKYPKHKNQTDKEIVLLALEGRFDEIRRA